MRCFMAGCSWVSQLSSIFTKLMETCAFKNRVSLGLALARYGGGGVGVRRMASSTRK